MLPILVLTWMLILPFGSSIISCRMACRRCREKIEHPEILEVYCAMCDECKERRREWLEEAPTLLRVDNHDEYLTNYGQQESQDECATTQTTVDEECDPPSPQLLTLTVPTTISTTTSTTTTTRKPCPPTPCVKPPPPTPPCQSVACAVPIAIPVCQMCPMYMTGSFYPVTASPPSMSTTTEAPKESAGTATTTELYFYLGVPNKLLKKLQLSRS